MCVCVFLHMQLDTLTLHRQQIEADQKDTQRLCMRKCLQGPERDIKHGASENPLSTAHVPPLCKVGAAQFTKINTTGRSERCGVSTYCVPPPVAHGRISMQGADI